MLKCEKLVYVIIWHYIKQLSEKFESDPIYIFCLHSKGVLSLNIRAVFGPMLGLKYIPAKSYHLMPDCSQEKRKWRQHTV